MRRRAFLGLAGTVGVAALTGGMGAVRSVAASATGSAHTQSTLSPGTTQLIVGLADDWSSTRATLTRFERKPGGVWVRIGAPIPARLGPTGLAWGLGLTDVRDVAASALGSAPDKVEGDRRAPAGLFPLETVYAYDAIWRKRTAMPFVEVGPNDLFVEDPTSPLYNTHVRLTHAPSTAWEKQQQMEQGDEAHRLKVFVGHNSHPPVPGRGSAIYLHVWRKDGASPTAGCTAMSFDNLSAVVRWIKPSASPVYVLLPKRVYPNVQSAWDLPTIGANLPTIATK